MKKSLITVVAAIGLVAVGLTGCSSNEAASTQEITIADPYVKAATMQSMNGMDMGRQKMDPMSAAFMDITNTTGETVTLTGGSSNVSERVEIHEVVDGVMRPIKGGLVINDGTTSVLEPGGNHVMLMGLTKDLKVGDEVSLSLVFSNGDTLKVTAPVKEIPAADEPYATGSPKPTM